MPQAYHIEVWSDGSINQYLPDLEFNGLVYEPRTEFHPPHAKFQAQREAAAIRWMENRWARAVMMEDGVWVAYASRATKEAN